MNNKYFGSNILCATICIVSTIYWYYNDKQFKRKIDVLYDNVYEVNEKCDKNKKLCINISKEMGFTGKPWQQELVKEELKKVYEHHFPEPMFESSEEEEYQPVTMDCEE